MTVNLEVSPGERLTLEYTPEEREVLSRLDMDRIPRHVACIMDGNGRWAKARLKERVFGHQTARATVREVVETCRDIGIEFLTLYTFSSENWRRPAHEVTALMRLLAKTMIEEREDLHRNGIRLRLLGDPTPLPPDVSREISISERLMASNRGMVLNLAINYGARQDMVRAIREIVRDASEGKLSPEQIDESLVSNRLSTAGMPDPELLIRSAGEYRISNFLLWEIAYTEIYVTDKFWPEFTRQDLMEAIIEFQGRHRKFGGL